MMLTLIGESLKLVGETLKAAADVAAEVAVETVALTGAGEGALTVSEAAQTTALTGLSETTSQIPTVPRLSGGGVRAQFLYDTGNIFELGDIFEAIDDMDTLESMDEVAPLPEEQMGQRALEDFSRSGKLPHRGLDSTGLYSNPSRLRANGLQESWGQECVSDYILDDSKAELTDERLFHRRKLFRALGFLEGQFENVQNAQRRR